jgi:hypothetical protein
MREVNDIPNASGRAGHSALWGAVLVGVTVLLVALILVPLLPLWFCPKCEVILMNAATLSAPLSDCVVCEGSGRVSLFRRRTAIRDLELSGPGGLPLFRLAPR